MITDISIKDIGKNVFYLSDRQTKKGRLNQIHKRSIYGHVCYTVIAKNGKKLFLNDLKVWK
jgi:hypothetical protein